jgi:hypothetical protein
MALPSIPIPLEIIVMVPVVFIFIIMILLWYILQIRRYAMEAIIFMKGRKKDLPVLCRTDIGSGFSRFILGKKKKDGDIAFDDGELPGILVDPSLLSDTQAMRFGGGLDVYFYASKDWVPLTHINALGFKTARRVARSKSKNGAAIFPELQALTDQELMALLNTRQDELKDDCLLFIDKYKPIMVDEYGNEAVIRPDALADAIIELKEILSKTPLDLGFYSFMAAFVMNPISHLAQDLEQLKMLIEQLVAERYEKMFKLMQYAIIGIMVMGAIVLGAIAMFLTMKG